MKTNLELLLSFKLELTVVFDTLIVYPKKDTYVLLMVL